MADSNHPQLDAAQRLFQSMLAGGVTPNVAAFTTAKILGKPSSRLLTIDEMAVILNRDPETIHDWVQRRALPVVTVRSARGKKTVVGFHLETVLKALTA